MTSDVKANLKSVFSLYERWGHVQYEGEPVTQTEHALQAAQQAKEALKPTAVVLGALLHDIGHLVGFDSKTEEEWSLTNHGETGRKFLEKHGLPSEVTELVEGHVNAKRYLTFKNPSYYERLSSHSRYTLKLQGGPMTAEEAKSFESLPNFQDIIQVREWDENAKSLKMSTKSLDYYRSLCESFLTRLQ